MTSPKTEITNYKPFRPQRRGTNLKTMFALKNKVQLIGNLGNAPEVKTLESGKKMARFSVATSESYRNAKGEKVTETQWHTLVAWGKVAEIVEKYLTKGKEVAIAEAEKLKLDNNHYYFMLLGELYTGIDQNNAKQNFEKALQLAKNNSDKLLIEKKLKLITR